MLSCSPPCGSSLQCVCVCVCTKHKLTEWCCTNRLTVDKTEFCRNADSPALSHLRRGAAAFPAARSTEPRAAATSPRSTCCVFIFVKYQICVSICSWRRRLTLPPHLSSDFVRSIRANRSRQTVCAAPPRLMLNDPCESAHSSPLFYSVHAAHTHAPVDLLVECLCADASTDFHVLTYSTIADSNSKTSPSSSRRVSLR